MIISEPGGANWLGIDPSDGFLLTELAGPGRSDGPMLSETIITYDLNGDGIVDSADMCIMVDHWGTDEPLCNIGPMAVG